MTKPGEGSRRGLVAADWLTVRSDGRDASFDLVGVILDLVAEAAPDVPAGVLLQVEREMRQRYGGLRVHIAKADRRQARPRAR